ncbi:hypothetical protein AB0O64_05880 [Streptomyces sp. NPDC088341]|uniref:hypothetical protein n=1 Tax=Streptomyces sp. NPDC088341 TaxID=3154870 RepID=UPI0034346FCA
MTARDIASRLGITPKSVSRATAFLIHAGLLQPGRGAWALTEAGHSLARLRSTDSARARLLLRDHWQDMWFHQRAQHWLASGPAEERELAAHLSSGVAGPLERGLFLIEWMTYALLIDRDGQGRIILPAGQQSEAPGRTEEPAGPEGIWAFLNAEHVSVLPDDEFLAVMKAYRSLLVSLTPSLVQQSGN